MICIIFATTPLWRSPLLAPYSASESISAWISDCFTESGFLSDLMTLMIAASAKLAVAYLTASA